jgi:uncharacterized lipoprotein YajG
MKQVRKYSRILLSASCQSYQTILHFSPTQQVPLMNGLVNQQFTQKILFTNVYSILSRRHL